MLHDKEFKTWLRESLRVGLVNHVNIYQKTLRTKFLGFFGVSLGTGLYNRRLGQLRPRQTHRLNQQLSNSRNCSSETAV